MLRSEHSYSLTRLLKKTLLRCLHGLGDEIWAAERTPRVRAPAMPIFYPSLVMFFSCAMFSQLNPLQWFLKKSGFVCMTSSTLHLLDLSNHPLQVIKRVAPTLQEALAPNTAATVEQRCIAFVWRIIKSKTRAHDHKRSLLPVIKQRLPKATITELIKCSSHDFWSNPLHYR